MLPGEEEQGTHRDHLHHHDHDLNDHHHYYLWKRSKVFWGDVAIAPQRPGHSGLLKDSHPQQSTHRHIHLILITSSSSLTLFVSSKTGAPSSVEVVDGLAWRPVPARTPCRSTPHLLLRSADCRSDHDDDDDDDDDDDEGEYDDDHHHHPSILHLLLRSAD